MNKNEVFSISVLFFHKWPDVQHTTSKMMFSHLEKNWKNLIQKQSCTDVLQKRCSKNFPNVSGKHLLEPLFKKVAGLIPGNIIKKRLRCFPGKFAKFLRTPFFAEHFWWLLLVIISLAPDYLSWVNRRFRLTQRVTFLKQTIV